VALMKGTNMVEQIERLEDQLQAIKWVVRSPQPVGRAKRPPTQSIVTRTAGLLQGRLPEGRAYQRRLRREWEQRLKREAP
jgi:hypothetical protein